MDRPLISICIPTYNRAGYLKECLASLTRQLANPLVAKNVEITILDNQSQDNTEAVAWEFVKNFQQLHYIKDNTKRDIIRGIIQVASLANGEYIWVFSDDDLQTPDSLETVINFINKNRPEVIFCNLIGFRESSPLRSYNLLSADQDMIISNRRALFALLNHKFNISIDYYTTLCSNWLITKKIFDDNFPLFKTYSDKLDMFPFPTLVFYSTPEYIFGVIAKEIILNRGNVGTWGYQNEIKHFFYRHRLWKDFYQKIIEHNRDYLPASFAFRIRLKNISRYQELAKILLILSLKKIGLYGGLRKIVRKIIIRNNQRRNQKTNA